ncbi:MAG TPA: hypothetical protein VEQ65_07320 [Opitutus sp.]|nr:hypothetical protein [Opitutus sp.]
MNEAPRHKFNRLVNALDELVAHEAATLQARDYEGVVAIGRRADPVVAALAELGPDVADDMARARVAGLLARRQHSIEFLETQLVTAREELLALQGSMQRVSRLAPVYGRAEGGAGTAPRFSAAG